MRFKTIFIVLIFSSNLFGQKKQYNTGLSPNKRISQYLCNVWQKDKGLPQNSIFSITQSSKGYIWIGTYEGLVRFDGEVFETFNTTNTKALKANGIWNIYEDSKKQLWIGTSSGGLTRYYEGRFETYTTNEGLPSSYISSICEDSKKQLWIGTKKGLCRFKDNYFKTFGVKDGLASRNITALTLSKDGTLWIGTDRGLTVYRNGSFENYSRTRILMIDKFITSIAEDAFGNMWIGTHQGLLRWNEKTQQFRTLRLHDKLTDEYITKVFIDRHNTLWIGTQSGGINRITARYLNRNAPKITHFTAEQGLSTNSVTAILEDTEGNLWIGTNRGGLNRLKEGKFTNFTDLEGLADDISNCVFEDSKGSVWVGTVSGGVSRFENGKFTNYTEEEGLPSDYVRSITEDKKGNIWFATYGGGISCFDGKGFRNYTVSDGLVNNVCRSLFVSRDGSLWIGTKRGVSRFVDGKFYNYNKNIGLSDNSVLCIHEDKRKNIWIGTENGGLNVVRPDNTIMYYDTKDALANNLVFCLYEDKENVLWIGTKNGLSRFKDGKFKSVFAEDGLENDAVHSLVEDEQGRLWMSCNSGVFWVRKSQLNQFLDNEINAINCTLYQEADGMKSSDCAAYAQPTVLKDEKGRLWYPTTEGIARINPKHIRKNKEVIPVVIKKFLVDNKKQNIYDNLELAPGKSKFEVDFAGLSFIAPSKVEYEYRLKGTNYSEKWQKTKSKSAFYTNLPPGFYTFEVRAKNNDGLWNKKGTSLKFYLKPFFYQTVWFYILVGVLIFSLAFMIYYWRIKALEKAKEKLEKGIEENTMKIRNQYKEIQQQAKELETIDNIVKTINQELEIQKVFQVLLEQGLLLFKQSNEGIFLFLDSRSQVFKLTAVEGYNVEDFEYKTFSKQSVIDYCKTGLKLDEDLHLLRPAINRKKLDKNYKPVSSLALQIKIENSLQGILFFDNAEGNQDIGEKELSMLVRFKEHAVSAFSKALTLNEIEVKTKQLEVSLKKISDSIRYARRIQRAILGNRQEILDNFEDGFIFYEPRDIVSGDFYWFAETLPETRFAMEDKAKSKVSVFKGFGQTRKVLAAVDCTGHGVPGAFMTVIGHDLLNAIVLEERITKAHLILSKLDTEVKHYLRQEQSNQSRDGMDVALIVIDEIEETIEFAGAKNPLYRIRNSELTQFKGVKYPIGGVQIKNKKFESCIIPYEESDIFYMFSDGFPDQFGGPQDRKYGSKRFRELLLRIHHLDMRSQRKIIEEEFDTWKGDKRQTDDILLIGIKM